MTRYGIRTMVTLALLLAACARSTTEVGSILGGCTRDSDCGPPALICSPDGACVPGCVAQPSQCVASTTCDATTGECVGGKTGQPCTGDADCEPPTLVCNKSGTCVAGCDENPAICTGGLVCKTTTGHCCDPGQAGCTSTPPMGCIDDLACKSQPGTVCSGGVCHAGCSTSGCAAPLMCSSADRCWPATCARDDDCGHDSYCADNGTSGVCKALTSSGASTCPAGVASISSTCNESHTVDTFTDCAGKISTVPGCPWCVQGACYEPGLCKLAADCHNEDGCVSGLCRPEQPVCPTFVPAADVLAGKFSAGHELCVKDSVASVFTSSDGDIVIALGSVKLAVEITPQYAGASKLTFTVGETLTVHGPVRWNQWRTRWEIRPVDYAGSP